MCLGLKSKVLNPEFKKKLFKMKKQDRLGVNIWIIHGEGRKKFSLKRRKNLKRSIKKKEGELGEEK